MTEFTREEYEFLRDNRLLKHILDEMERREFDVAAASHPDKPDRVNEALFLVKAVRLLRSELRTRSAAPPTTKRVVA